MDKMNPFEFSTKTHLSFGLGVSVQLGAAVARVGKSRALVISDPGVARAGLVEPVLQSLQEAGIFTSLFAEVCSNPTTENARAASALALADGCDVLIAVGGGSTIDAAKGVAILAALGGALIDYEGWDNIHGEPLPVVALPTTAGTGSEVTFWAVISDLEAHRKFLIGSPRIAPTLALLDPALTFTLPEEMTFYTGIDALTHALEAYTSKLKNPISDALAIAAIEKVGSALPGVMAAPENELFRSEMLLASTIAGMAFNNADLGAVHCLSEALGGAIDIHHGLANAIFLLPVMEFNAPAAEREYSEIAEGLGNADGDAVAAVRRLLSLSHLPSLRNLGLEKIDLPRLAQVASENISVSSNPREIHSDDFMKILLEAY
jgi:alcohol dehydrogenase